MRHCLLMVCCLFSVGAASDADSRTIEAGELYRPDGSSLRYFLAFPPDLSKRRPLLVLMQGSDCNSVINNPRVTEYFRLAPQAVILMVEKYGVDRSKPYEAPGEEAACPPDYLEHNTVSQRVLDYLQVIAALRRDSAWWSGDLGLWGGSEGAMVASYAALLLPATNVLVASSFGGGRPLAGIVKASIAGSMTFPSEEARDQALRVVEERFATMRREPVPGKTMGGAGNTYKWWADALDLNGRVILEQLDIPILVVQGEADQQAPVEAARHLAEVMAANDDFTYKEYPGLDHFYEDSKSVSHRKEVIEYQRQWLEERLGQ